MGINSIQMWGHETLQRLKILDTPAALESLRHQQHCIIQIRLTCPTWVNTAHKLIANIDVRN